MPRTRARAHWSNLLVETINRNLSTQKLQVLIGLAKSLMLGSLTILVIWLGSRKVLDNTFSVGMLLAFISYQDQFLMRVSDLIDRFVQLKMLKLHGERVADISFTKPEPQELLSEQNIVRMPVSVEVQDLRFRLWRQRAVGAGRCQFPHRGR